MASITPSPTRGDTILHQLSSYGYEGDGALRACLAAGRFPVNAVNSERATPLHLAVRCAYFEGISLLLAYGADPNAADARGRRSLHFSALLPNFSAEAARALLKKSAQGEPYRLIGVSASDFTTGEQLSLFDVARSERDRAVTSASDKMREKYGDDVITRARLLDSIEED